MECKDVLIQLREKNGLSQQELADRMFITRQAVSRWERGETLPSSDLLKSFRRCSKSQSTPFWTVPGN